MFYLVKKNIYVLYIHTLLLHTLFFDHMYNVY